MIDVLKGRKVIVLGLGNHGGGQSSALFAHKAKALSITIADKKTGAALQQMLTQLQHIQGHYTLGTYDIHEITTHDIVIKNPAIPKTSPIIQSIIRDSSTKIETDISLFYQYHPIPTIMVTGTKGKSTTSAAIHALLTKHKINTALAGNITNSPLNILLTQHFPQKIVLELSSFQIGDLSLVSHHPFAHMEVMIFTNIMRDHLNYYPSMQEYSSDKLFAFRHLHAKAHALLPYEEGIYQHTKESITMTIHGNQLSLPAKQCIFHNNTPLPTSYRGTWIDEKGLWIREESKDIHPKLILTHSHIPPHIHPQNIAIISNLCHIFPQILSLPHTSEEWTALFQLPHRKEYLGTIKGRKFINDSAATIPQAMQLHQFKNTNIHLITGGTDKNLHPEDFLDAITLPSIQKLYLLEGSFTNKLLPLLNTQSIPFTSPYHVLSKAVHDAFEASAPGDTIILSSGCSSFDMFLNEFERGDQFRDIVTQLQNDHPA